MRYYEIISPGEDAVMDYREIRSKLPVSINSIPGVYENKNFFDAEDEGVTITATNTHFPMLGNHFMVTFEGKGWTRCAVEATRQLGRSIMPIDVTGSKETLAWPSPRKEIPTPIQIKRIGRRKLDEIIDKHHLNGDDVEILKALLIANQMHTLNPLGIKSRVEWLARISHMGKKKSRRRIKEAHLDVELAFTAMAQEQPHPSLAN